MSTPEGRKADSVPVRVKFVGDLRRFVDADVVELTGGECSLAAAFDQLAARYPRLGGELFDDKGNMHYAVVLLAAGLPASWPQDKDRLIEDDGELLVTRFHSGG